MERHDPFDFPHPLPPGACAVGPAGWQPEHVGTGGPCGVAVRLADLGAVAPDGGPAAGLLLLHGDHLRAAEAPDELALALQDLRQRCPDLLPVLLFRELTATTCCELFRAGLFDALEVPVTADAWARASRRLEARLTQLRRNGELRRGAAETTQRLHAHRRQLRAQAAEVAEELLQAQRELEEANRKLTAHMAQISLLYQFGRELSTAPNWDATLRTLLEKLAGFVGSAGAALVLRSAPGGACTPRQTYRWEEGTWDRVLVRLEKQLGEDLADRLLAPGIYQLSGAEEATAKPRGLLALPLEHQGQQLGYLLLLDRPARSADEHVNHLPFLQAVQVIMSEEVAAAQMLDRMREIGTFNARVLETVRSGIWVMDEEARTVYCNRAARGLLTGVDPPPAERWEPDFAVGRGREERARFNPHAGTEAGGDAPELFLDGRLILDDVAGPPFARLLARSDAPFLGEGRILRPGGEAIPVMLVTSLMPGRGPGERWLVVVAEDLREAKKLEAERIRADRLESLVEMSATLAHEIRNPLTGLSAQAELLAEQLPAGDKRQRYIEVITGEVERINATINRLLNFVRPYEPQLREEQLPELARDCLELVRPRAEARGIGLHSRLDPAGEAPASWTQELDGAQIKQVLLNLLLNAVDASPAGGRIDLCLRQSAGIALADRHRGTSQLTSGTVLEIWDDGPGFAEADHEKLFRPFYTTKSSGTGLGLSICRKIVTAHGGEIHAGRQEARTVFRVLLPRARESGAPRRRQEAS